MELNDLKITETAAVDGITALSDRPNVAHTYGGDALSAKELKERFDKLPSVIIEKFNDLLNYFSGGSFPNDITFDKEAPFATLKDFLDALTDGRAAETIKAYVDATKPTELSTLQDILSQFERDKVSKKNAGEEIELKKFILDSSPETLQSIIYALYDKDGALGEDITDLSSDIKAITEDYENGSTAEQIMVSDENSVLSSLKNVLKFLSKKIDDIDVSDQIKELAVLLNPGKDFGNNKTQSIDSNVRILGNLFVTGKSTVINTESLTVENRHIVCNSTGVDNISSGLIMITGSMVPGFADKNFYPAYAILYDETSDTVRVGQGVYYIQTDAPQDYYVTGFEWGEIKRDEGNKPYISADPAQGQALATRENSIADGNIPQWDDERKMFVDSTYSADDFDNRINDVHSRVDILEASINGVEESLTQINEGGIE